MARDTTMERYGKMMCASMSLYLTLAYQVTKAQAAMAVIQSNLLLRTPKYVFDLGQGPLVDALTTYREEIEAELADALEIDLAIDDFAATRGKHDPAHILTIVSALRAALGAGDKSIVARINACWKSDTLMRAQLADLETFCSFGVTHGLQFGHTLA